jgi:SagB-type dehydrogenase family enzyme
MLNSAQARDEEDWPHEHAEHQKLKFFVLAKSVSNLRLGFYEYDYQRHGLDLIKEDIDADLSGLFVQPEFGTAPAAILITGNLASGCARWGAFGYRQLLLRAGAAANRLWISALDLGLAGCIVAGLVAGATTRQLGLDGYRSANLLAFVVGHRTETKTIWP